MGRQRTPRSRQSHAAYRDLPKYAVSTSLRDDELIDDRGPTLILRSTGNIAAVKRTEGRAIIIHDSAELARRLAAVGLIDRYNLLVYPVLLSSGMRVFEPPSTTARTSRCANLPPARTATPRPFTTVAR